MYKVFADGEILCSSEAEELALLDPIVNLEANCAGSFTFKMPPDHPFYDSLVFRQTLIDVYLDDELIFEGVPVSNSTDFYNVKTVECEGELSFLNDTVLTQAKYTNQTVSSLLAAYLQEHNDKADTFKQFQLGSVTVDGGNSLLRYTNYQTTMQEIGEDLVDNFGGYLRVRHDNGVRYLDYLAASPRTSSQVIQIGKNLMDLVQDTSTLDICTVLIPLGAKTGESQIEGLDERLTIESVNDGKNFIIGTGAAYFGYVWKTATWDDVTVPANLLAKGQAYLADAQWANLVITATAYDLGLAVEDVQKFRVLDTIRVVSEPHGLDRNFMLTALQIDLNHPGNTQITLGSEQTLSLSAQSAALTNEINSQTTNIIRSAAENARQILESATGGNIHFVYDQDGVCTEILIMDTNDIQTATKIWRWNINGWGYSGNGGQTYSLAATMNGHIYADFVDVGTLQSGTNNANWWNLDTGEIKIGNNANIAGWAIDDHSLSKLTTLDNKIYRAGIQATQSPVGGTAAFYVQNQTDGIFPFIVRYDGSLTATKATITGNITANSLTLGSGVTIPYNKVANAPDLTVYVAKDGLIGNTPAQGATGFKVSSAGLLTASNAVIYGTLYSSAGKIAGWNLASTTMDKTSSTPATSGRQYQQYFYMPDEPTAGNWAYRVRYRDYTNGTPGDWVTPFRVAYDGSIGATGGGTIGAWTLTAGAASASSPAQGSFYSGMPTIASTSDGIYLGYDGIALGGGEFKVTRAGNLTATSATIKGNVTATSGAIGGWDVTTTLIKKDVTFNNVPYQIGMQAPVSPTENSTGFYVGYQENGSWKYPFRVRYDGKLFATGAEISGTFVMTGGSIDLTTDSQTDDRIKLSYSSWSSSFSPLEYSNYNSSTHDWIRIQAGGIFGFTNASSTANAKDSFSLQQHDTLGGALHLYDTSGNLGMIYSANGMRTQVSGVTTMTNVTTVASSYKSGASYTIPSDGWYFLKANFESKGNYNLGYLDLAIHVGNGDIAHRLLNHDATNVWSTNSREEVSTIRFLTKNSVVYARLYATSAGAVIGTQIEYVKL